ncbi:MAG: phosphocholine cytidylyltransferase family protein [Gammaproteobacteria bacterium]|nr:phosphocholine cytidylyltransferase family protein [Gammaproteobacteria bacterium]
MSAAPKSALLLAAGAGKRFTDRTDTPPKCLIEINGMTLLERLCRILRANGFTRLTIVTGYRAADVEAAARACSAGLDITTVHNADYATTNNVYSLWLARRMIDPPFLLVESDLVFGPALVAACHTPDCLVISQRLPWMNGTTIELDTAGGLARFQLAADGQPPASYKTVNVYCFSQHSWQRIATALDNHIAQGNARDFYEAVLADLVDRGQLDLTPTHYPCDAWYEIDTAKDLAAARQLMHSNPDAFNIP